MDVGDLDNSGYGDVDKQESFNDYHFNMSRVVVAWPLIFGPDLELNHHKGRLYPLLSTEKGERYMTLHAHLHLD